MAKRLKAEAGGADRAGFYLRMSSPDQDESIEQQRPIVQALCDRQQYRFVGEYVDEAITGARGENRANFMRLLADAKRGMFDVILAWDIDRFGRFDPADLGHWIREFKQAGVRLETANQGRIDWDSVMGQFTHMAMALGKAQFLRDTSKGSLRGHAAKAKSGRMNGNHLFGYDRIVTDDLGNDRRVTGLFRVPKGWKVAFAPAEDGTAEMVRWMFQTYGTTDTSIRSLIFQMNAKGVRSPRGRLWSVASVAAILKNPKYTGAYVWGRKPAGRYFYASGGDINQSDDRKTRRANDPSAWTVHENKFPALVDAETFGRVQKRLERNRERKNDRKPSADHGWLLSGLLVCGNCGRKMHGSRKTMRWRKKTYHYQTYKCTTYQMAGRDACSCNTIAQAAVAGLLTAVIRDEVLQAERIEGLRKRLKAKVAGRTNARPSDVGRLRKRIDDLTARISRGAKRVCEESDDEVAAIVAKEIGDLRRQKAAAEKELAAATQDERPILNVDAEVDRLTAKVAEVAKELEAADPARVRELFGRIVDRVDLFFDAAATPRCRRPDYRGLRRYTAFSRGMIHFRPDFFCTVLSNVPPQIEQELTMPTRAFSSDDLKRFAARSA